VSFSVIGNHLRAYREIKNVTAITCQDVYLFHCLSLLLKETKKSQFAFIYPILYCIICFIPLLIRVRDHEGQSALQRQRQKQILKQLLNQKNKIAVDDGLVWEKERENRDLYPTM
jgi:hypothetical protein